MNFHTAEVPSLLFGCIFSAGQNNLRLTSECELAVPEKLIFRRIYVGFITQNCGEPIVRMDMVFKRRGNTIGNSLHWEWAGGISPAAQVSASGGSSRGLLGPSFKVDRIQYPSGNDMPSMESSVPNSKMVTLPLQDNVTGIWYLYNVVMPPFQMVEEFSTATITLDVTSGAMPATAIGQCFAFGSIDSCKYPI